MVSRPAAEPSGPATLHCSFCGRDNASVRKIIAGPSVYICDACVAACQGILNGPAGAAPPGSDPAEPSSGDVGAKNARFGNWRALPDDCLLRAVAGVDGTLNAIRGVQQDQVMVLRERGINWATIGDALGVSRQSAWERFGKAREGN
jgi:hypothetical protein